MYGSTILLGIALMATTVLAGERQLTNDPTTDFYLDDNHNFSLDSRWLAYDTRKGLLTTCMTIEKVNVVTGERVVLYRAPDPVPDYGPGLGAVSYFPNRDEVIFIHGPFTTSHLAYEATRRTGAIVPGDGSGCVTWADARDVAPPYTPGALRGGTHRHDPGGPNGRWIGYTYNDQIMANYGKRAGRDLDLRTLGVTYLGRPVAVDPDSGEGRSGTGFSVLVVKVTPYDELDAQPGSDGICQAAQDQWVGARGYRRPDGSWQIARAFIGTLRVPGADGRIRNHQEVFVVDIPDDITVPGPNGPLEGTDTTFPAPPRGTVQRRLTHTERGCSGYVRSPSDGSMLTFLSADTAGKAQVFAISPLGGPMRQLTHLPNGASEPAIWLPDDRHFLTVTDNRIIAVEAASGRWTPLTEPSPSRPTALAASPDGKLVAFNRDLRYDGGRARQIFLADVVLPR